MARITPGPLPGLDSPSIQKLAWSEASDHYRAYATILQAEKGANIEGVDPGDLVSIRVAGYFLLEFLAHSDTLGVRPSEALVRRFAPQISQSAIIDIGTLLREKFIHPFRATTTGYSQPSSHPSRPSFDTMEDMIRDTMESTGNDYRTLREKALARDGYRCVITGIYDEASLEHSKTTVPDDLPRVSLQAAHIFNESTMQGIDPTVSEDSESRLYNKTYAAASALAVLKTFGFSEFADTFIKAGGVHQVWNMFTLQYDLYTYFERLKLWFEQTEKPHRYRVRTLYGYQERYIGGLHNSVGEDRHIDGAPMFVEFNAEHPEAPPPDPLLLAIHATCARVAHMSGAAEFFDELERAVEEMDVLAPDGSSALLLSNLLFPYAVIRGVG